MPTALRAFTTLLVRVRNSQDAVATAAFAELQVLPQAELSSVLPAAVPTAGGTTLRLIVTRGQLESLADELRYSLECRFELGPEGAAGRRSLRTPAVASRNNSEFACVTPYFGDGDALAQRQARVRVWASEVTEVTRGSVVVTLLPPLRLQLVSPEGGAARSQVALRVRVTNLAAYLSYELWCRFRASRSPDRLSRAEREGDSTLSCRTPQWSAEAMVEVDLVARDAQSEFVASDNRVAFFSHARALAALSAPGLRAGRRQHFAAASRRRPAQHGESTLRVHAAAGRASRCRKRPDAAARDASALALGRGRRVPLPGPRRRGRSERRAPRQRRAGARAGLGEPPFPLRPRPGRALHHAAGGQRQRRHLSHGARAQLLHWRRHRVRVRGARRGCQGGQCEHAHLPLAAGAGRPRAAARDGRQRGGPLRVGRHVHGLGRARRECRGAKLWQLARRDARHGPWRQLWRWRPVHIVAMLSPRSEVRSPSEVACEAPLFARAAQLPARATVAVASADELPEATLRTAATAAAPFTVVKDPYVEAVEPRSGPLRGGSVVRVSGRNFAIGDGARAASASRLSPRRWSRTRWSSASRRQRRALSRCP